MTTLTFLTVEEVAALTGLRPRTIRQRAATGKVDAIKVGRDWVFTEQQAAAVKRQRRKGTNP